MSLYTDLLQAEVPIQSHEGALHCLVTPKTVELLGKHGYRTVRTFIHADGQRWYDVPGAFDP